MASVRVMARNYRPGAQSGKGLPVQTPEPVKEQQVAVRAALVRSATRKPTRISESSSLPAPLWAMRVRLGASLPAPISSGTSTFRSSRTSPGNSWIRIAAGRSRLSACLVVTYLTWIARSSDLSSLMSGRGPGHSRFWRAGESVGAGRTDRHHRPRPQSQHEAHGQRAVDGAWLWRVPETLLP